MWITVVEGEFKGKDGWVLREEIGYESKLCGDQSHNHRLIVQIEGMLLPMTLSL